jgi:hypothetical protein
LLVGDLMTRGPSAKNDDPRPDIVRDCSSGSFGAIHSDDAKANRS